MTRALYGLGRACTRHRYLVLGAWAVLLIGLAVGAAQAGSLTNNNLSLPGTDSQKAQDLLAENFPKQANGTNPIVLAAPDGKKLTDDAYQQPIADAVSALQKTEHVITVISPLSSQGAAQLSTKDPAIGYISVALDVGPGDITEDEANDIIDAAKGPTAKAGLQVAAGGYLGSAVSKPSTESSDIIGLSVAVVVLLLAFGSVVAMGLPIITAVLGLICGLSVITLLSHVADIPTTAPTVATMIGLAVGIDYSLFVVTKHRTQVAAGMEVDESIARAVATAGGAVVFAGGTVALSLLALAVAGIPLVTALGWTAAIAVVFAILAALTLLPALFALLGGRIMALQLPFAKHHDQEHEATFWRGLATWITRHPWPVIVLVLALLFTLAIPTLSLRLGQPDAGSLPTDTNARQANDLIEQGFTPGLNGPFLISATFTKPLVSGDTRPADLQTALTKTAGVASVSPPTVNSAGTAAVYTLIPTTAPSDLATENLVSTLRDDTIPAATKGKDETADVGGTTAGYVDLADEITAKLIPVILIVAALSFLVLLLGFRSPLLAAQAAVMNLVSVAAAYGVLTAVFQWGWATSLIGLDGDVAVVSYVPLIMFAVLFGLSTDYQVFLLTKIQEHAKAGRNAKETVIEALSYSGRIILAAALVMISVFASFILNGDPTIKQFGVGLATAVAIDALVVCLFVPALLTLAGRATLWLPHWLDRILPRISIEGDEFFATREGGAGAEAVS